MLDFLPNQTVGLAGDAAFSGVYYGKSYPDDPSLGAVAVVYVKAPGASGKKQGSVTLLPMAELVGAKRIMR